MDFGDVLNLEDQYYQDGFQEGRKENLTHNLIEGKQYGLQVGFQRFLLVGLIQGCCKMIKTLNVSTSVDKNIDIIIELIDEIPHGNEDASVQIYERNLVKLKNKFRLLLMALSKHWKNLSPGSTNKLAFETVENVSKVVAGELNAYVEDAGLDVSSQPQTDMW
ncbi:LAME_0G02520g1_1 [Lachancea meyersii CBS 8951]|uniref:LAME_0G02520g1_1 n=1 Tax=Lachancea meyersii CBS 8951 TaxID=1266667 RepID=A0A1G4K5Z8_9SACH|nr:LAME_0G02520g1_1 [Lachancea meyersii CBS 8951]